MQASIKRVEGAIALCAIFTAFSLRTGHNSTMMLRALCLSLLLTTVAIPISVYAEDNQSHILWHTVSPDGKYAIAWATSAPEPPLDPQDEPNPVSNWLIEIATSKKIADLPGLHFWWSTHEALDHYFLDTVWSDDSRYLLILLNQHFSLHDTTVMVQLADIAAGKATDLTDPITDAIKKLHKNYDGSYFVNPWFVAADRFFLVGDAGEREYDFYFEFAKAGQTLRLAKAVPTDTDGESSDRYLNREYRKLRGLLSADEQKALVEEERAWLRKRDATKSAKQKEAFTTDRGNELQLRADKIVDQKSD
jgi:Lysozyme inhibitor LprI